MNESIKTRTPREEFQIYRRALLKEHNIKFLICARCGHISKSIHLHHIVELVHGGKNETSNLIPLCGKCHEEWDCWGGGKIEFGTFLLTPRLIDIGRLYFGRMAISPHSLKLCRAALFAKRPFDYIDKTGDDNADFEAEFVRQNKIFNCYPYSDNEAMFNKFGSFPPPLVLEDLQFVTQGVTLEECIKSKASNIGLI